MDFLFSGKIEERQIPFIKKNALSLVNNKPNKAIRDTAGDLLTRNKLSLRDITDDKLNYSTKPCFKEMGVLSDASKNTNNYLSPLAEIDNREKIVNSPLLCNTANYTLERRKIHNRNKSENFSLFSGRSVNHEKYFEMKKMNLDADNTNKNIDFNGRSRYINSPNFHRRNASNLTEAYKNNNDNSLLSNNSLVNSSNFNNNSNNNNYNNAEILDNKNNLFNIKNRRLEKKNLYNPKYNEKEFYTGKVSSESPNWFSNKSIENYKGPTDKEPIFVFSKHSSWITLTPEKHNRNKALEKRKIIPHETSIIAPSFMQIKTDIKLPNIFKSIVDASCLKRKKGIGMLVDRQIEKPTLFNYGTYNHNVSTKQEVVKLNESLDPKYKRLYPSSQE